MKEYIVRKEVTINAHPTRVWEAMTNPEKTKKYFFDCEISSSWKTGSPIYFKGMYHENKIEMKGDIVKIIPGVLLLYTIKNKKTNNGEESVSTISEELNYRNGKTTLSVTDHVGDEEGAEERFQKSEMGWIQVLSGLKAVVESEKRK